MIKEQVRTKWVSTHFLVCSAVCLFSGHQFGRVAKAAVDKARKQVANMLGCQVFWLNFCVFLLIFCMYLTFLWCCLSSATSDSSDRLSTFQDCGFLYKNCIACNQTSQGIWHVFDAVGTFVKWTSLTLCLFRSRSTDRHLGRSLNHSTSVRRNVEKKLKTKHEFLFLKDDWFRILYHVTRLFRVHGFWNFNY